MCGIAGLIHRGKSGDIGKEMTAMLQSLKHRGPDSTGYALYGSPKGNALIMSRGMEAAMSPVPDALPGEVPNQTTQTAAPAAPM